MTFSEMLNIGLMQGFAGLSLFSVLLLMGLGLAVIFGQMGVINMAHGEFMTIGAYTIYLGSTLTEKYAPNLLQYYFPVAIVAAFIFAFLAGWLTEWALIRHLYKRPLDTLLATWGLSLGLQQLFRSTFGPKEVSPTLPDWLMGSWSPSEGLDIPINGLFVMGLTALVTGLLMLALYKARWGLRVRATVSNRVMANAIGINTKKTDRLTFAIGCGIAGVAGAAFTTSTRLSRSRRMRSGRLTAESSGLTISAQFDKISRSPKPWAAKITRVRSRKCLSSVSIAALVARHNRNRSFAQHHGQTRARRRAGGPSPGLVRPVGPRPALARQARRGPARPLPCLAFGNHAATDDCGRSEGLFRRLPRPLAWPCRSCPGTAR